MSRNTAETMPPVFFMEDRTNMKRNLCMLGCVMIGTLAACSAEPVSRLPDPVLAAAADAAVVTPCEPVTDQMRRQFARELRILSDTRMTRETIRNSEGSLQYCQGVYNEDLPGKPAILVFLHGIGERGSDNLASIRLAVPEIVKQINAAGQKVVLLAPQCPADQLWATRHRGGAEAKLAEKPRQALGMVPILIK